MAKLESANEVIEIIKSGKYENEVNAKRGVGRTRLSKSEKAKVFSFIEEYFQGGAKTKTSGKPGKKAAKKAAKKVGRRPRESSEDTALADDGETSSASSEPEKTRKGARRGALGISPSEVRTVADILDLVDNTVQSSVRVINALKAADEVSKSGDITRGIENAKRTLEGAAILLHQQVVMPLAHNAPQADPSVVSKLEAVVAASESGPMPTTPTFS